MGSLLHSAAFGANATAVKVLGHVEATAVIFDQMQVVHISVVRCDLPLSNLGFRCPGPKGACMNFPNGRELQTISLMPGTSHSLARPKVC
jgi:hypothetical protein